MKFPQELRYAKSHEWAKQDGAVSTVGVTEYAQKELSDVVYVELPDVGKKVSAGDAVCVVESVKAAFDIYAPISGIIKEVNRTLESEPGLVNTDCYGKGWFFKIEGTDSKDITLLMDAVTYEKHVAASAH